MPAGYFQSLLSCVEEATDCLCMFGEELLQYQITKRWMETQLISPVPQTLTVHLLCAGHTARCSPASRGITEKEITERSCLRWDVNDV